MKDVRSISETETLKNFDDETIFFIFAKPTSNNLFYLNPQPLSLLQATTEL